MASDATYSVFSEAHTKVNVHVATIVRVSISEVTKVTVRQWRALVGQVLNTQPETRSRVTHIEAVIKGRVIGCHRRNHGTGPITQRQLALVERPYLVSRKRRAEVTFTPAQARAVALFLITIASYKISKAVNRNVGWNSTARLARYE